MRKTNVVYKTLASEIYPDLARSKKTKYQFDGFVDNGSDN